MDCVDGPGKPADFRVCRGLALSSEEKLTEISGRQPRSGGTIPARLPEKPDDRFKNHPKPYTAKIHNMLQINVMRAKCGNKSIVNNSWLLLITWCCIKAKNFLTFFLH